MDASLGLGCQNGAVPMPCALSCLAFLDLALLTLGAWAAHVRLRDLPVLPGPASPLGPRGLVLCIPARNEARALGPALDSWLAQDWPGLALVVVDDGSTDGTPGILARRALGHGNLQALRNDALPPGWLGKNHALDLASRQPEAREAEWLLFADADVLAAPDLLGRAFAFLEGHPADLLTLLPAMETGSLAERVFIPFATLGFLWAVSFRGVPDPARKAHCGVGAFLLVRREAYDAIGGHRAAPMDPIDDMGLALRLKEAGFTNRVALAGPRLRVRMYGGLADLLVGMRKNALALPALFLLAPLAVALVLALTLFPPFLLLAGRPLAGAGLWLAVPLLMAMAHRRFSGGAPDPAWLLWPLNGLLLSLGLAWAFADRIRGINHWRGRDVPLVRRPVRHRGA